MGGGGHCESVLGSLMGVPMSHVEFKGTSNYLAEFLKILKLTLKCF